MSGGLSKLATNAQSTFNKVQGYVEGVTKNTKKLGDALDDVDKKATRSGNSIAGMVRKLGMVAVATAALTFAKGSVTSAMQFGATTKSFEVLTGSKKSGQDLANQLNQLQQNTILGPEVFKAGQTLMGFGIAANQVIKIEKMLGDVSMGNKDKFESLTLAFSQTHAAGRLMGQDLLQYINAGFNPLKEISDMTGISMAILKKRMEEGAISADMVSKAFEHATGSGGKFNGMMDQIAETSYGKMQILEGQWENFKIQFGNALMPLAEDLMSAASKTLDWLNISKTAPQVLMGEQAQIDSLVGSITSLNEGNSTRAGLLDMLKHKYPELFGNLDTEKTKNSELLDILDKVNASYQTRIGLASSQLLNDTNTKILKDSQSEYIRNTAIIDAINQGNLTAAKSLMTGTESVMFNAVHWTGDDKDPMWFASQRDEAWMNMDNAKKQIQNADIQKSITQNEDIVNQVRAMSAKMPGYGQAMMELSYYDSLKSKQPDMFGNGGGIAALGNYDYGRLKKFLPSQIAAAGAKGNATGAGISTSDVGKAVTSGGPRVININGVRFADKIEVHAATMKESIDELQKELENMFLRVLNSGASVQ